MPIESPFSKYKRTNFKIYIVVCILAAIWFGYDGYFNKNFKQKHTDPNGKSDSTLRFNQISPPFFLGAAVLLGAYFAVARKRKIVADENELILSATEIVPYASIQKIDKTHFSKKGFFVITYTDKSGKEVDRKMSDRKYDNLGPVLDHLVTKIS